MPTLFTGDSGNTGILTPRVGPGSGVDVVGPQLTDYQQQQLTQKMFNTQYSENRGIGWAHGLANTVAGSVIDLADTVASSVSPPSGAPLSVERGDVWNLVGDYGGPIGRDLQDYYTRNQSRIETISGIGGAIATAGLASELLLPRISSALANSTAISGSKLWQAGAAVNASTRANMLAAQAEAAMSGEAAAVWSGAGGKYLGLKIGKAVGKAAFEEAAIGITMHTNQAVWSDDASTNLLFAGLGLGVGGVVGTYGARAEMRALANDPSQILARADAVDPQGFTQMREATPQQAMIAQMRNVKTKESANFTSLMLEARQATPQNAVPQMATRFDTLRVQADEQAVNSLQRITTKGIDGITATRFNVENLPGSAGDHVLQTARQDPLALFGLDSIGALKPNKAVNGNTPLYAMLEERNNYVNHLTASPVVKDKREARRLVNQQPLVLVDNGWLPAQSTEAYGFSAYQSGLIKLKPTAKGVNEFVFPTQSGKSIRVNEGFDPKIGRGGTPFHQLDVSDRLEINEGMSNLFDKMIRSGDTHVVPAKPNWYQLDSAVEFERRGGKVDWQKTPGGIVNADAAKLESLKQKSKLVGNQKIGSYWERLAYNLPLPNTGERIYDSMGDAMRNVLNAADQGASLGQVTQLRNQLMETQGFDVRSDKAALDANMFNFNRDDKGKWKTPVLGFFDQAPVNQPLTPAVIAQQVAESKAERIYHLTSGKPYGGIVQDLTRNLMQMPEFAEATKLRGLADDQITGIGNAAAQASGEILTREFRFRDSPAMLAAMRVREATNRVVDEYTFSLTKPLSDINKRLSAAPAAGSKALVNQFASNTSGWDILTHVPVPSATGGGSMWGFELAETAANEARLGRKVVKGETLVNPRTGAPIVLDDLGLEFIDTFNQQARRVLKDKNKVRVARGLSEIREKSYYTPPPDTRNSFVGFTFDDENQLVPNGAIVAKTREEFERLRRAKTEELAKTHPTWNFRSREAVAETADLYDRAAMDWIDPGVGYGPVKGQKGTLASDRVNPDSVGDMLQWLKRQSEQIGTDTMRSLFDSQLGIARARGAVERITRSIKEDSPIRTIWDEYESIILGRNLSDSQRSISGPLMQAVESRINYALASSWKGLSYMNPAHLSTWVGDLATRLGAKNAGNAKSFDELVNQLGPYSPYTSATDYAEQNLKVNRPPEIREISQKIGRVSSALLLRYFELPQAAMNMIGIITTMPSILRSGKAPVSGFFNVAGERRGVIDVAKILGGAIKDHVDPKKAADWDFMVKNGDTTQQVADFNKQMSTVQDQSSWKRVFLGDKTTDTKGALKVRSLKDAKAYAQNKGVDGLISVLTDTTENWSRTWAHFAGLRLADMQGITGLEARHAFAREIANAAIANYNPLNRPELYQSAFGSMFGLFMSYMQSYNQRLFRWMEKGDYASIGHQMGVQSALFGVASMPGFNAVQSIIQGFGVGQTTEGEEASLLDNIYARFGPEMGSAIAHGGISQLGVALYTRGDMNYRDVTLNPARLMAGVGIIGQAVTAVHEAAQSLFSSSSIDDNDRILEILARNMPNRVLKGVLSQIANGGADVDSRGQLVTENKDFFETTLRMLGVRSTRQQGMIEAFYANKQKQQREAARMDVLRDETRAYVRTNKNWMDGIQGVFDKYLANGGRPEHFRTWIRDQVRATSSTRDVNDLVKAFRNPKNQSDVWRYGAYGGG